MLGPARWLVGLMILLLPAVAEAHAGGSDTGLMAGLMHPVFGPDHLLAMISVGVVSVQLGGRNIWRIPLAFVGAMTIGAALAMLQFTLPHAELGIAVSVLVLGLAIVVAHRGLSPWPITAAIALFGTLHGYAHGVEIPRSVEPGALHAGLSDRHRRASHLRHADRRSGLDADMALAGIAFHWRRSDGDRCGVPAANTGRDGLNR